MGGHSYYPVPFESLWQKWKTDHYLFLKACLILVTHIYHKMQLCVRNYLTKIPHPQLPLFTQLPSRSVTIITVAIPCIHKDHRKCHSFVLSKWFTDVLKHNIPTLWPLFTVQTDIVFVILIIWMINMLQILLSSVCAFACVVLHHMSNHSWLEHKTSTLLVLCILKW